MLLIIIVVVEIIKWLKDYAQEPLENGTSMNALTW